MYHVYVEVKEGTRYVTRLCLGSMSAERLIRGAEKEFRDAAKFLEGCIRADVENKDLKHEEND
jgi:hypothetical protein